MSACSEIQNLLPVSPDAVSPEEYRRIKEHLEKCPVCREMQQDLLALYQAAAEIDVPEPGEEYWDDFALRVGRRISVGETKEHGPLVRWFVYRPAFSWPTAAVALVLVFFITRAMMPDRVAPPETAPGVIATVAERDLPGPMPDEKPARQEIATVEPRSEPVTQPTDARPAIGIPKPEDSYAKYESSEEIPDLAAEGVLRESTISQSIVGASEFEVDAVPEEEMQSILVARDEAETDRVVPERRTIILKGDTVGAEINNDLPSGRDLARAERPNAPFPVIDTVTSPEAQRILGAPGTQEYSGIDRQLPTLNKDEFTSEDREFFRERIAALSKELSEKKGGDRIKVCRELADMHYQLALIWRGDTDIKNAVDFMAEAREILPADEHPDLDAKAAALKSLIGE